MRPSQEKTKINLRTRSQWLFTATWLLAMTLLPLSVVKQAVGQTPASSTVPTLVQYSGVASDINGKPLSGVRGVTFYFYKDSETSTPLWMETQNVQADSRGRYTVMLGATASQGLPKDLFATGEARWLGVQTEDQAEQPRVLLLSVPYALKAADAETIGGLPPSAFVLATAMGAGSSAATGNSASSAGEAAPPPAGPVTGTGTLDFIPLWTSTSAIGNSSLFQSGSGTTAKIGINTTTPGATLDVRGTTNLEGPLTMPSVGAATATSGKPSQAQDLVASSFNSGTAKAVNQTFQWKAEPSGNNTATPAGTLNLLFGSGGAAPVETGLKLSSKGMFTFATGQTFPGTGTITGVTTASGSGLTGGGTTGSLSLTLTKTCATNQVLQWNGTIWACATMSGGGSITGVTAGTDLTGGGTSGNVTLSLNTAATDARYAQLGVANTFTGNETFSGNVTSTGTVNGAEGFFSNTTGSVAVEAIQNDTTRVDDGIAGIIYSPQNGSAGVVGSALTSDPSAQVFGVMGTVQGNSGVGVYGVDGVESQIGHEGGGSGVWGDAGSIGFEGVLATADNVPALVAANQSSAQPAILGESFGGPDFATGIVGFSGAASGLGIYGSSITASNTYLNHVGFQPIGVVGDAGDPPQPGGTPIGLWGAADSGIALVGENASGANPTSYFYNSSAIAGEALLAGGDLGTCNIDVWGDESCSGVIGTVAGANSKFSQLYAVQSPENWFEDFGSGELAGGAATVTLDAAFAEITSSSADYRVFLTPNGDCKGLYVTGKTATGFTVRELGGGQASVGFDYRIVAHRKGYENVRLADATAAHNRLTAVQASFRKINDPKTRPQIKPRMMRKGAAASRGTLNTPGSVASAAGLAR
ncbi:MAG TPA: hypothetical protein VGG14_18885 [Candidatus Sulfotelmatobacter sp.]|jgi:hypothetical protein